MEARENEKPSENEKLKGSTQFRTREAWDKAIEQIEARLKGTSDEGSGHHEPQARPGTIETHLTRASARDS